ncbi:hypothetical protein E4U59_007679 [Claviceps monticola]|nr:hypothetical protein E4U59_007679 [Claviceps monticola]
MTSQQRDIRDGIIMKKQPQSPLLTGKDGEPSTPVPHPCDSEPWTFHQWYRGKVKLDWGGMTMEMSPAAVMNFLTTAVIVEENDKKVQQDAIGGESIGMGRKIMDRSQERGLGCGASGGGSAVKRMRREKGKEWILRGKGSADGHAFLSSASESTTPEGDPTAHVLTRQVIQQSPIDVSMVDADYIQALTGDLEMIDTPASQRRTTRIHTADMGHRGEENLDVMMVSAAELPGQQIQPSHVRYYGGTKYRDPPPEIPTSSADLNMMRKRKSLPTNNRFLPHITSSPSHVTTGPDNKSFAKSHMMSKNQLSKWGFKPAC